MRSQSIKTKFDLSDSLSNDFLNLDSRILSSSLKPTTSSVAFWTREAVRCAHQCPIVDVREAENDSSCWFSYLLGFCQQVFFTSVNLVALCSEPAVAWMFVLRHNPHCPSALSVGSRVFGRPVSREASSKGVGRDRGNVCFQLTVMGRHSKKTVTCK